MKIRQIVKERLDKEFGENNYHLICVAITGSYAYGMQTKDSDHDIMGLFLPPENYIIGLDKVEQVMIPKTDGVEGTIYDFRKWYYLLLQQNPNILELLWHEESQYVYRDTEIWPILRVNREQFLSKKLKHSFAGYAFAQLNRLDKLNEKVNENKKRLEEFERFGYSTKNASHLMRLLNTAFDALVDKEINVMRPERQFLISIREGKYSYDQLVKMANQKFNLIEEAYMKSDLRNRIDHDHANRIHIDILKHHLGIKDNREIT
jgi:predicted nucleotidyltransferase